MKICENCGNEHNGSYGSGRFCSMKCSRSFSTKNKRKEINEKVSNKLKNKPKTVLAKIICPICNIEFQPKKKTQKLCSVSCSRKYRSQKAHEVLRNNPPNWSEINKKSYSNGHNKVAGGTSKWICYEDIKVQGTYEFRTCIILDKMKEDNLIKHWEYTGDRVPYIGIDGKNHTYLLDFKIINNDDSFYYLEVKGYKTDNDDYKWNAVRSLGYELVVWYLKDIESKENELKIKKI